MASECLSAGTQKVASNLRLINLKGKKFVFGGSKNSNLTDHIAEKSLFV
jgi:hypothetical protein